MLGYIVFHNIDTQNQESRAISPQFPYNESRWNDPGRCNNRDLTPDQFPVRSVPCDILYYVRTFIKTAKWLWDKG